MPSLTDLPTYDPIHRVAMSFERDADDHLWVTTEMDDGGHLPEHFHPVLEEHWEVLEGGASLKLDGTWRELSAADGTIRVAPGARHEVLNRTGARARLRAEVIPPGRLQDFLTESAVAAREGLYNGANLPTSLRGLAWASDFITRFSDETVMCSPPPALTMAVMPVLARLTRRFRPAISAGQARA